MNKAILLGRAGKDPEITTTQSGKKVSKLSLATSKKINGTETTQWHSLIFWENAAEIVEKYVKKGSQLLVEGEIQYREYEKDGAKRYITEIVCNQIKLLGGNTHVQQQPTPVEAEVIPPKIDDLQF